MASFVQFAQLEPGSSLTSPEPITLTGTTAGNMLVLVQLGSYPAGQTIPNAPTDNFSNSWSLCSASSGLDTSSPICWQGMYWCLNKASGSVTVQNTWTGTTAGYCAFYLFEVSGVNSYDTGSFGSTNGNPTTSNASTPAFNVSHANSIVLAATINGNSATGPGAGFTLIAISAGYADCLEYALPAPGPFTATAVLDGSSQNWQIIAGGFYLALPPAPSTGAGQIISAAGW